MRDGVDDDARHAAQAILGGRARSIKPDALFAALRDSSRFPARDVCKAQQEFDALTIGSAVEAVEVAASTNDKRLALLKLARLVRPHLASGQPGWFRFLLALGSRQGESAFLLSYTRRPKSDAAMPKTAIARYVLTRRSMSGMLVAGSILSRIEAERAENRHLGIDAAIDEAISSGEIETGLEAARKSWQHFRKDCSELTQGADTYRLKHYDGSVDKYKGRWLALPDIGIGLPRLPSDKGGRPQKTG